MIVANESLIILMKTHPKRHLHEQNLRGSSDTTHSLLLPLKQNKSHMTRKDEVRRVKNATVYKLIALLQQRDQ